MVGFMSSFNRASILLLILIASVLLIILIASIYDLMPMILIDSDQNVIRNVVRRVNPSPPPPPTIAGAKNFIGARGPGLAPALAPNY
ncbi:hypothetical protein I3842_06G015600 [Carya illinoinensis]|nr:hypothetical protein I3842_06G015600 [Carya illinoinensis]